MFQNLKLLYHVTYFVDRNNVALPIEHKYHLAGLITHLKPKGFVALPQLDSQSRAVVIIVHDCIPRIEKFLIGFSNSATPYQRRKTLVKACPKLF